MTHDTARTCITCQQETPPEAMAFTVVNGACVCAGCWEQEPGIDTTGERYASHKAVKRFMLSTDGPWWIPAPVEPGKAHMFAIATVTPPPAGFCVHCGKPVPVGQGEAEQVVAGTPLVWLSNHCWVCFDADPACPDTCKILEGAHHA